MLIILPKEYIIENLTNIDILWILVCAFLVFLMQLGFAMVETGVVRAKNTINVAMKNLVDTVFGVIFFWIIGFGLMFGSDVNGLLGTTDFAIDGKNLEQASIFFFQAMFAATAVTIVSGAVAERIKFNAYIVVSIIVTSIIYPIFGHWAWSDNGWLKALGFADFAGSTVVHSMGAWIGLAGAIVLGPRLGKFKNNKIKYFAPSNHNFIVFGVFILFFAWFGFNAGSLLKFDIAAASILMNTVISGVFGGLGGWVISLLYKEKVNVEILSFGIIAGLVGITAGCDQLSASTSAFIGFSSAIVMHIFDQIILKKFHIDDPLSVISVHGFVGVWGTIAVGIFAALPQNTTRIDFILVQILGTVVAFIFAFSLGLVLFYFLYKSNLLRVSKKHEVTGLNVSEHNAKLPWVDTIESIVKIMKSGNFSSKIHVEKQTEVGLVATFFNYLLVILKNKQVELTAVNIKLKRKSEIDPLTKILNRRAFMEQIKDKNPYNHNFSVILIDIDYFKLVNDSYGHSVGDSVLIELSEIISNNKRETDIFARWGGEEFLLAVHTNDKYAAQKIAEGLRVAIQNHLFVTVKNITASFGVSSPENESENFQSLFENADKALYRAKELGRNKVSIW